MNSSNTIPGSSLRVAHTTTSEFWNLCKSVEKEMIILTFADFWGSKQCLNSDVFIKFWSINTVRINTLMNILSVFQASKKNYCTHSPIYRILSQSTKPPNLHQTFAMFPQDEDNTEARRDTKRSSSVILESKRFPLNIQKNLILLHTKLLSVQTTHSYWQKSLFTHL